MTIDSNILLEYIYFSFVLWVRSSELKVEIFLPSSADTAKKHQIIALNRIINNNFEYKGLSFSKNIAKGMTTCEGSRCSASCIPLQACIQSNGILVNQKCFLCGMTQYYQNKKCNNITCPENMTLVGRTCVCKQNYFLIHPGVCSPCPLNAHWSINRCVCNDGFYMLQTKCIACPKDSIYEKSTKRCLCKEGFYWF